MKKIWYTFCVVFIVFPHISYAQWAFYRTDIAWICWKSSKYSTVSWNISYVNPKKLIKCYLQDTTSQFLIDKRNKIWRFNEENYESSCYYSKQLLPDTFQGNFKIAEIIKRKNNWELVGEKLKRKIVYLINLECIDSSNHCPNYITIISPSSEEKKEQTTIKKESVYNMVIYSHFEYEIQRTIGMEVRSSEPIRYGNIWLTNMDMSRYNYFETNNLCGLYYISTE